MPPFPPFQRFTMQTFETRNLMPVVEQFRSNKEPVIQAVVFLTPAERYFLDSAYDISGSARSKPSAKGPGRNRYSINKHFQDQGINAAIISNRDENLGGALVGIGDPDKCNGYYPRLHVYLSTTPQVPSFSGLLTDFHDAKTQGRIMPLRLSIPPGSRETAISLEDMLAHGIIGFSENEIPFAEVLSAIKPASQSVVNNSVSGEHAKLIKASKAYGGDELVYWAISGSPSGTRAAIDTARGALIGIFPFLSTNNLYQVGGCYRPQLIERMRSI